jgi:nucleoid-associated protein YgaU
MAVNPLKIFLFLAGVVCAGGATAFVSGALDPYVYGKGAGAAAVAELPQPAPSSPAAPKDERLPGQEEATTPGNMAATPPPASGTPPMMAAIPPADATPPPADQAAPPPATMAAKPPADATQPGDTASQPAGPQPPTFDVVRVEADGSLVVAGRALPDSLVELLQAATVIGSTTASAEGDFVIILDTPLKPGAYQLTLRSTPRSGTAVASVQTAVLSIPEKPGGQVLAMVEQPGQPSQILTAPQPETPPAEGKPVEVASAPDQPAPPSATAPKVDEAANPPSDQPKTDQAAAPPADTGKPAEEKPGEVASAPAQTPPPAEPKPGETTPAPAQAKVAVEAVEIEGSKIFVAGVGDPGRSVRVYANEIVLGETKINPAGRFLVEAQRDLPVGQYMVRADLLDADGVTVIARAVVPFEREEGEAIAAVAPDQPNPPAANPPAQDKPAEVAAADQPPADAGANPATPPPAASTETPPANNSAAGENPPANPPAANPAEPAPAVAANEQPPADNSAAAENPPPANPPAEPKTEEAAGPKAEEPATQQPGTEVASAPPPETTAPKLVKVQGSVIIRRGDSLWRISRRVYGHGMRYSTIYLANQQQISDPDRIWPGQVFHVPDQSKEGEPADMKAMGDQMIMNTDEQAAGTAQ